MPLIKRASIKFSSVIKNFPKNSNQKISIPCLGRLLEEDLKVEKFTLDPNKKFVSQQLHEVSGKSIKSRPCP
ncbi:hypothetical protein JHK85_006804 [Glycine max]|nr:hypothetical protein JHK85_006804 [Glycine max]